MESKLIVFFVLHLVHFITCPYPPTGDEVVPGSVLLPASRRGRYLANIVRRQAVDGTGIKFNKDADRMNAEAKKKVDVLSDELLPYIIAEQERRTTLYKRLMTAIQNGEKGVTIAEIRNKSPLIIRKGVMFRCPANRAPKEPDGTGVLKCDEDIDPTQIMYDSCLSAEDKDLYVADNKYFFCNRHRIEGPDLPRNGSTVIGCAPTERTSLNYTTGKCALEDTDDVVVHYRYYPDRTYKFVTELDPDHEVCDHWNPCQIGYIYSLPGPDQALPATDLWRGTPEKNDEYERDEFVPPIPEDTVDEFVPKKVSNYTTSPRRIPFPKDTRRNRRTRRTRRDADENTEADADAITEADADASTEAGTEADADASTEADADASTEADADASTEADADVSTEAGTEADADASTEAGADASTEASSGLEGSWRLDKIWAKRNSDGHGWNVQASHNKIKVIVTHDKNSITVMMYVAAVFPDLFSSYYVIFTNDQGQHVKSDKFLTISESAADVKPETVDVIPGQKVNNTLIPFDCYKCKVISVLVRTRIGDVHNCDPSKCSVKELPDKEGNKKQFIEIALDKLKPQDVGDFFIVFINVNAVEEKVKVLQVETPIMDTKGKEVAIKREDKSLAPGDHFDHNVKFECIGCELKDVTVNGHSAIEDGKAASSPASKTIIINFPSFDDFCAGVYIAIFIKNGRSYQKVIDVIDNSSPSVKVESPANVTGPSEGEQFETEIPYTCEEVCTVEAVTVNGLPLNTDATPCVESCMPGFVITTSNVINIKIPQFTIMFEGIFQAVFSIGGETNVTKTIMEITPSPDRGEGGDPNASPEETPPKEVSTELSPSGPSPSGPSIGGLPNINLVVNGGGGVNGGVIVDAGASIKGGVVIEGGASVNAGVVIEGGAVNAGVVVDGGVAVKGGIDIKGGINAGIGRKGAKRNGAKTTGAKKKGAKRTGAKTTATKKKGAKMTGSKRTGTKTTGTKKTGAKMTGAKTTGAKTTGAKTTPVGHVTGTTSATLSATTKASSEASTVSVKAS